jgi:hypothetical protein
MSRLANVEFNGDGAVHSYVWFDTTPIRENPMTKIKTLSAIAIISAAIATPVFAQDAIGPGYGLASQPVTPYDRNFRGAYNQSDAEFYARPLSNKERRNIEDFGFSGRDASRVGGEDPYLHPGG